MKLLVVHGDSKRWLIFKQWNIIQLLLWSKSCWLVILDDRFLQVLGWYYRYCWCCLFAFSSFLWLVITHKKFLPLRVYGSMSEVFLRKFLTNSIYFISKKYAVRKNSEASMKTINTEAVFNWPNQYVRGVASTLTNIWNRDLSNNFQWLLAINYCGKTLHVKCFRWSQQRLCIFSVKRSSVKND